MATADEIIVKLTAENGDFNAGMDEAAAKVKASTDAMAASVQSSLSTFRDFDAIQKSSIKTAQDAAAAQATLAAAQASGAYTTEELAAKQAILDAAMAKLPAEMEAAGAATVTFANNSRVMGEVSTIVSEAMSGNFGRIRRSAAALANQTGILNSIFSPLGAIVVETGAALAGLVYFTAQAEEYQSNLAQALLLTSGGAGVTKDQLLDLTQNLQAYGAHAADARDIVLGLTSSGRIGFDDLGQASQAASLLVELTGIKADDAVKKLVAMGDDPVRAAKSLEEQMGFLTQKQADEIVSLQKAGDKTAAFSVLLDALVGHLRDVETQTQATTTRLESFLHDLNPSTWVKTWEDGAHNIGTALDHAIDGDTLQERFNKARDAYMNLVNEAKSHPAPWMESLDTGGKGFTVALEEARQKALALQQQLQKVDDTAKAAGQAAQTQKSGVLATLGTGGTGDDDAAAKIDNDAARIAAAYGETKEKLLQYWQDIASKTKEDSEEQVNALEHVNEIQKQLASEQQEAARKGEEAARKEAEAEKQANASTMQGLEVKRSATQEYSAQRIALDSQIVATAARLYGQDSSQYRTALDQKLADTKAFIQKQRELNVSQADGDRQIADARISFAREQAQTEFDAGQINAQQLLQTELDLDRQKLAADVAYYNAKKKLDADDAAAILEDNNQIVLANLNANQQMEKDQQKFFTDSEKNWKQYTQRTVGAMQNAVNSMLFQHQTLRAALASIAESMGETFIEVAVMDPLEHWLEGEARKVTSSLTTQTTIAAAEQTQRAANTAADIADKSAAVIRAAGVAGAEGTASFAGAPWPIDIGAPAFGAAMMASALSFGSMASAAGGWDRIPADTIAQVHRDEMVLPKHIADPMRDMAKRGGSGGGDIFHIHANDAKSFMDIARRRPGDLAKLAKQMRRQGHRI